MTKIFIPEQFRKDVGGKCHWDSFYVDIRLKDGRVKRGVNAQEGICITESLDRANSRENLDFTSADIVAVRPTSWFLPFFVTELLRKWQGN
jgi:hypothetical protein